MIPTDACGGWPMHYNWFGANECLMIGSSTKGNSDYNSQQNQKVWYKIEDSKWKNERPRYNLGIQDNEHNKNSDMYYVSAAWCGSTVANNLSDYGKDGTSHGKPKHDNKDDIKYLFEEGGMHVRGFISDFQGYYNTNDWYQNNAFCVYNTDENNVYPFPVKGISFTIRVPEGKQGLDAWGNKEQYGDHVQINQMHGLWMDKDKKYYAFELMPQGDNKGRARVSKLREPWHNGDPAESDYYFLQDPNKRGSSFWTRDNKPDLNQAYKLRAFTVDPMVEDLFFMGFSCLIRTDKEGAAQHSHTLQFSNVAPIPFFAPRRPHPFAHRVIIGEPTALSDIKKGAAKIHYDKGRKTRGGFSGTNDTWYRPDGICPGYGEDQTFGDIPPNLLPQPDVGDDVLIPNVSTPLLNSLITSNKIPVDNFNAYPIDVTADGNDAKLSVDGGPYVAGNPGVKVNEGENFEIQMKSPSAINETTSTVVTVGDMSPITWTITAELDLSDTTPNDPGWEDIRATKSTKKDTDAVQITGLEEEVDITVTSDSELTQFTVSDDAGGKMDSSLDEVDGHGFLKEGITTWPIVDGQYVVIRVRVGSNSGDVVTVNVQIGDGKYSFTVTAR